SQTGTHVYMAPELLAGGAGAVFSDIYSLGGVVYQLLGGNFNRPLTTDWAKRKNEPLFREDFEKRFGGGAEGRFANAGELAAHLRAVEQRRADRSRREKATARQLLFRRATAALVTVTLLIVALLYAFKQGQSGQAPHPAAQLAVLPLENALA